MGIGGGYTYAPRSTHPTMTVLVADSVSPDALRQLADAGHHVAEEPGLTGGALTEALAKHDPASCWFARPG